MFLAAGARRIYNDGVYTPLPVKTEQRPAGSPQDATGCQGLYS